MPIIIILSRAENLIEIRKNWVPIFDKYHLTAAFENHDHAYKRTHLLSNNTKNDKGVLYLGDGAWGVKKPRYPKSASDCWYIANSSRSRHLIKVTIYPDKREYQAINSHGEKIDEFTH